MQSLSSDARMFLVIGSISAASSIILGAFTAHLLRDTLMAGSLSAFTTGVDYQFYHSLGLLLTGISLALFPEKLFFKIAGWMMLTGMVLFSGSLYLVGLGYATTIGFITPVGGVILILSWLCLAYAYISN